MTFDNKLVNEFMKDNKLNIIEEDGKRPWGDWYIIRLEKQFDTKVLRVIPKTLLSLQYHGTPTHQGHSEKWVACTNIRALISKQSAIGLSKEELTKSLNEMIMVDIKAGGTLIIGPGIIHALANPFDDDIYVIETRLSEIVETSKDREDNIVRIYDQTNRNGTPSFPPNLVKRILDPASSPDYIVNDGTIFDISKFNKNK